jgi:hypothetical protein
VICIPRSKRPLFHDNIPHNDQICLYTINDLIRLGVGLIELKEVVPDPCKSKAKDRHVDHFKDVKGQKSVQENEEGQSNADDVQTLIGFALVVFEVLLQERVFGNGLLD